MLSLINLASLGKIVSTFIGCGLISGICITAPMAQTPSTFEPHQANQRQERQQTHLARPQNVSIQTMASSSPHVTVVTDINGNKSTRVITAPYGIRSSIVSTSDGSTTKTAASATPLSEADEMKMEQDMRRQMGEMQQEMERMFARQERSFHDAF